MNREQIYLRDWTLRYIKNKDLILKKIVSTEELEDGFHLVKKDNEQRFFVEPFFTDVDATLKKVKAYEHNKALVFYHTKENYDALLKHWKNFVDVGRDFTLFIINPFSKTDRVLTLSPYTHNLIADPDSLDTGLKTMSGNVEFTTEKEIKKIISS